MTPFDLAGLQQRGQIRRIEYLPETDSTNNVALALAESEAGPYPLLVLTARQTAGRGRGANRWWSSEGALTFSLALDSRVMPLTPERRPLVSLAAGLAACEAVASFAAPRHVGVKWPNDVYLEGKKICGILVESAARGERLVVGVGVNVNNTLAEAPDEVANRATALVDAVGQMFPLTEVLDRILQCFFDAWSTLHADHERLVEKLRQRCLLSGRLVAVQAGEERISGLCRGLADDGALLMETEQGRRRLYAGVVVSID